MDWLRTSLIGGIAIVCFLLMIRWTEFQEQQVVDQSEPPAKITTSIDSLDNPNVTATDDELEVPQVETATAVTLPSELPQHKTISIDTDVLHLTVDLTGGDIVELSLPTFYAKLNTPDEPFVLLKNSGSQTYIATSGLVGKNGIDKPNARPLYKTSAKNYSLKEGDDSLAVDLVYQQSPEVTVTKRFNFSRASHLIEIEYIVNNNSASNWQGVVYGQIKRNDFNPVVSTGLGMQPYLGGATTMDGSNYEKVTFDDMEDEKIEFDKKGGWVAMVQHYFFSAWIPDPEDTNSYFLTKSKTSDYYYLRFTSPAFVVPANSVGNKAFSFYAGPKDIKTLEHVSPYLDLTVDYGILWWIAKPLFYGLDFIHGFVGNWGIAIILLTVLIKAMFFFPSAASYRSMAKMRKVQPKMAELKERYGDNKQKFSAEMMKLYKEEKVNPLGGCLPILIQMPVFIALYWVLMESVDLRHAPFFFWIHDLSVKDPYFILPLIMGATMFIQQKLNPTPPDPMQAKVMQMMPVFFTFLFLVFPAGLVLYWVVNNTLSIIQQYIITKQIEKS